MTGTAYGMSRRQTGTYICRARSTADSQVAALGSLHGYAIAHANQFRAKRFRCSKVPYPRAAQARKARLAAARRMGRDGNWPRGEILRADNRGGGNARSGAHRVSRLSEASRWCSRRRQPSDCTQNAPCQAGRYKSAALDGSTQPRGCREITRIPEVSIRPAQPSE